MKARNRSYLNAHVGKMTRDNTHQAGYVMVYMILGFAVISIIGLTFMNLSRVEAKTSSYNTELKKAHEAARAGVDWAMEEILASLQEQAAVEELPRYLLNAQDYLVWADASSPARFKIEAPGAELAEADVGTCTYLLSCTGINQKGHRTLRVLCQYRFTNVYDIGPEGEPVFKSRVFSDCGRLVEVRIEK